MLYSGFRMLLGYKKQAYVREIIGYHPKAELERIGWRRKKKKVATVG
ncbi:hypothetical protein QW060_07440 [Myroides ceti]|uniref:Uncharacterized protein n=1 Tax=Paenimyroides ceti TaxID=395087 RepID=A0ABT8CSL7_9FLAO|nr:hypothetical protein [Paenimyroides ceti]MDN3706966.1 hypothetical protein [Paenimyroides ceti]